MKYSRPFRFNHNHLSYSGRFRTKALASVIWFGLLFLPLTCASGVSSAEPAAAAAEPVEVFDVGKEEVVATFPNSQELREQADRWLQAVQRLSGRADMEAEQGIVIHIPLNPPLLVKHSWLSIQAADLYLFIDPRTKENPHMLVFSNEGKPYVFDGPANPEPFLQQYHLLELLKR
ncbi:hypothetical protein [Paenibacillus piri]|uniref:Uncharacterized protein n=1 Tax=Paenibacillus piri TaxID=2547395 RepID=A0A4R5K9Y6_9BACL|nr:hypothetical protein [Paenibacillus piri]TDF91859.1 hypothetical protein E1757_31455 [Paenibacillus piri]